MAAGLVIACQHCATLHERAPIEPGAIADCTRCGSELYRQSGVPLDGWIALVIGTLLVFAIANYFPIATLTLQGMTVQASLPGALWLTWQQDHQVVAVMTGLFGFGLPLMQLLFLLWALMSIRSRRLPADFHYGLRFLHWMESWSMVPVLMLGILVAMVKFSSLASLAVGPGLAAFAVLTLLLTGLSRVTAHRLWRDAEDAGLVPLSAPDMSAGQSAASCSSCGYVQNIQSGDSSCRCERCHARIHLRKPDSTARVWALIIAAGIAYIPANVLPVMQLRTVLGASAHTILGGVIELWQYGSWDLALVVFVASVVVPLTKILALVVLMLRRRWHGAAVQRQRTRLYELVEFIGQWSMLDVFVVILLSAMADFPDVSQVVAGPGAASFGLVVILTMLAAASYDPRQGWDSQPRLHAPSAIQSHTGSTSRPAVPGRT